MIHTDARGFDNLQGYLAYLLREEAQVVDVGEWQSIRRHQADIPQQRTIELRNVCFSMPIDYSVEDWQNNVKPNLPWAEDHFQERVSGIPYNPPPSAAWWPFAVRGHAEHIDKDKKFSHTYPERFWPKHAEQNTIAPIFSDTGDLANVPIRSGIRYAYGDLSDVVSLLSRSPYTRQAYLPVWFPEDTGSVHGERVPCTLGYHFLLREGKLHCNYFIRSCDFFRHFADDVYLAGRLTQWMVEECKNECYTGEDWGDDFGAFNDVVPGDLTMFIGSLHIFEAERKRLTSS